MWGVQILFLSNAESAIERILKTIKTLFLLLFCENKSFFSKSSNNFEKLKSFLQSNLDYFFIWIILEFHLNSPSEKIANKQNKFQFCYRS